MFEKQIFISKISILNFSNLSPETAVLDEKCNLGARFRTEIRKRKKELEIWIRNGEKNLDLKQVIGIRSGFRLDFGLGTRSGFLIDISC